MSFKPVAKLPCGCEARADYYGVEMELCRLHHAAPDLLAACKAALEIDASCGGVLLPTGLKGLFTEAIAKAEGGAA